MFILRQGQNNTHDVYLKKKMFEFKLGAHRGLGNYARARVGPASDGAWRGNVRARHGTCFKQYENACESHGHDFVTSA